MAGQKTKPTSRQIEDFLAGVAEKDRADSLALIDLMRKITGEEPKMWGPSIIGFGQYHYKYDSGHEGDICLTGFSPRKQNISLYCLAGFEGQDQLLGQLGKHKAGKGCLYVRRLQDIDIKVLESLIRKSIDYIRKKYP